MLFHSLEPVAKDAQVYRLDILTLATSILRRDLLGIVVMRETFVVPHSLWTMVMSEHQSSCMACKTQSFVTSLTTEISVRG